MQSSQCNITSACLANQCKVIRSNSTERKQNVLGSFKSMGTRQLNWWWNHVPKVWYKSLRFYYTQNNPEWECSEGVFLSLISWLLYTLCLKMIHWVFHVLMLQGFFNIVHRISLVNKALEKPFFNPSFREGIWLFIILPFCCGCA